MKQSTEKERWNKNTLKMNNETKHWKGAMKQENIENE